MCQSMETGNTNTDGVMCLWDILAIRKSMRKLPRKMAVIGTAQSIVMFWRSKKITKKILLNKQLGTICDYTIIEV